MCPYIAVKLWQIIWWPLCINEKWIYRCNHVLTRWFTEQSNFITFFHNVQNRSTHGSDLVPTLNFFLAYLLLFWNEPLNYFYMDKILRFCFHFYVFFNISIHCSQFSLKPLVICISMYKVCTVSIVHCNYQFKYSWP